VFYCLDDVNCEGLFEVAGGRGRGHVLRGVVFVGKVVHGDKRLEDGVGVVEFCVCW